MVLRSRCPRSWAPARSGSRCCCPGSPARCAGCRAARSGPRRTQRRAGRERRTPAPGREEGKGGGRARARCGRQAVWSLPMSREPACAPRPGAGRTSCRWPLAAGRWPLAAGRWPLAAGRWPLAAGRWPLAAGRWPLAAGRWPLAAGRWPLAAGRWPLAAGRWPLAAGRWPLAAGRWPLAAGRWPLAAGRWPLAAGRWPLAAGRWPIIRIRARGRGRCQAAMGKPCEQPRARRRPDRYSLAPTRTGVRPASRRSQHGKPSSNTGRGPSRPVEPFTGSGCHATPPRASLPSQSTV